MFFFVWFIVEGRRGGGGGEGGVPMACTAVFVYDHRPPHPHDAGPGVVGESRQDY